MTTTITVQNLKCGGCANTISKAVQSFDGISDVSVNIETSEINFNASSNELIEKVKIKLSHLGYPEIHSANNFVHKTVSVISCATGRITLHDSKDL